MIEVVEGDGPTRAELPEFLEHLAEYISCGFTDDEAVALVVIAHAASHVLALDELHPSDGAELTAAFHLIQARLFMRPAYRTYLEVALK